MSTVPCCPCASTTGMEARTPMGMNLGLTRAVSCCACCRNYGVPDPTKDHKHFYLLQACKCHQRDLFSVLPAESALKMDHGPHLSRHPTRRLKRSGGTPPRHRSFVKKMAIQGSVLTGKDNILPRCKAHPCATPQGDVGSISNPIATCHVTVEERYFSSRGLNFPSCKTSRDLPREYADRSSPRLFASVSDSSTLEEATENLSLRDVPRAPCPEQLVSTASDQAAVSPSSEWRRELEAAEALLILRASPQAPSRTTSQLQPWVVPAPAGVRGLQPSSSSLRPRLASSVSLPVGQTSGTHLPLKLDAQKKRRR